MSRESFVRRLREGDRIWLFIGGDACEHPEGAGRAMWLNCW